VSGGKDSQVLAHLAFEAAARRGRKVEVFFLDQEAEYAGSIQVVERLMAHPCAVPRWYQVPLRMTNATSHRDAWLRAWAPGERWMRDRHPLAVTEAPGAPDRFYDWFPWYERQSAEPTAFLVGIRSRESLTRWRAVKANPGWRGVGWSTKAAQAGSFRFYPVFDWAFGDVWKYLADEGVRYNPVYDALYRLRGGNERSMRVSFLLHEQSYRALATLQELEPETFDRLVARVGGAHYAGLCAEEAVMSAARLPARFESWREFRRHLVETTPLEEMPRFAKRMARQGDDEGTCREHVRQLLVNDWENNVPVRRAKPSRLREVWWDRL
jgi:predicted phosphoadenosine phosphosulfate sulfurtransferase